MRLTAAITTILLLFLSKSLFGQEWIDFNSREDHFSVNFPSQPKISQTVYKSEYGADLPARVYSTIEGQSRYVVTVVDYNEARRILTEKAKQCRPGDVACNGLTGINGEGNWKNDVRGAIVYASAKYLQSDVTVTSYMWNYMSQTEGHQLQITNRDKSRTFVSIYMQENRLYILEGTVPAGYPLPQLFQLSLNFLNGRHEGMYYNGARIDPYEKEVPSASSETPSPQGWIDFTSRNDSFKAKFPSQPKVTQTVYRSEYLADLPAYTYTTVQGQSRYTITVANYTMSQPILTERSKTCPPGTDTCIGNGGLNGDGYWKVDVRGAITYASWQLMRRDAKFTNYKWGYVYRTEGQELELTNPDQSHTFAGIYMYANRLYILEATVPPGEAKPKAFFQSLSFLDALGRAAFHEGLYINGTRIDPWEAQGLLSPGQTRR